jgi:opacity protein-like surface antigen/outer membrane protein OmpA-like peptidoglycan-associated protein
MTMMSSTKPLRWRRKLLALAAVLASVTPALPQSASTNAAKPDIEGEYASWDLGGFFGTQWYQMFQGSTNKSHELLARPVVGVRASQNIGRYFGVEEIFGVAFNRLALLPSNGNAYVTIGARNYQIAAMALGYLTPRDHRFRPYVGIGPTGVVYQPYRPNNSDITQTPGAVPAIIPTYLRTKVEPGFTYGIGVKMRLSHRWDTQIEVRNQWTPDPDYGLPSLPGATGSLYVTQHHGLTGLQFTTGLNYRMGLHEPPPPVVAAPPPPPPPPAPPALTVSNIQGAPANACPGDNVRLSVTASGGAPGATYSYQWSVNGRPAAGGTGNTFNLSTVGVTGSQAVSVTVTANGQTATSNPVNVAMRSDAPPTLRLTVNPTNINYGQRSTITSTPTGSDCGGTPTVRITASEGTIAGNQFDSTGLTFSPNSLQQQCKVVHINGVATDSKNRTANATADVNVCKQPNAQRKDIVFALRSARVNNAAKRYLLETVVPELRADPGAKVILIGHRDKAETGRAAARLDRERVENAAAVLSAGKSVCANIDPSRIQAAYAGDSEQPDPDPFGDASVKERRGQGVTDDRGKYRRVEVWVIPSGAETPNVPGLGPVPEKELKAKGCPK